MTGGGVVVGLGFGAAASLGRGLALARTFGIALVVGAVAGVRPVLRLACGAELSVNRAAPAPAPKPIRHTRSAIVSGRMAVRMRAMVSLLTS